LTFSYIAISGGISDSTYYSAIITLIAPHRVFASA